MSRTTKYIILDTETATLPFIGQWELSSEDKKKLAIAKPLVYDIRNFLCSRNLQYGILP